MAVNVFHRGRPVRDRRLSGDGSAAARRAVVGRQRSPGAQDDVFSVGADGVGFAASMLHLGSPLRAMNALNRLGASPLSNEIATGSLFFALGGLYWLLAVLNRAGRAG